MSTNPQNLPQCLPKSCFAPAQRDDVAALEEQRRLLGDCPLSRVLLESGASNVLILNRYRQIVAAGRRALELLPASSLNQVLGQRPGEALHCQHSNNCTGGCGTSEFCVECGAVRAILRGLSGTASTQECRIQTQEGNSFNALDLRVTATPHKVDDQSFVVLSIDDIRHEKRRSALERIFFHDVMNLAGGVDGLLQLVRETEGPEFSSLLDLAIGNVRDLMDEIRSQRDLHAAERDELSPSFARVCSLHLLLQVSSVYRAHPVCRGCQIILAPDSQSVELSTDAVLLRRILGNLVKNAAEASPGGSVVLNCLQQPGTVVFSVWNDGVIPVAIQHQIFQRSFSTKGEGRGLGTYSVKLLGERYLGGRVSFESSEGRGTVFRLSLPLDA